MLSSRLYGMAPVNRIPMAKSAMVALLGPALWLLALSAQAQAFQPGEWEATSKATSVEVKKAPPGLVEAMKQPTTERFCMTPAQASNGFQDLLKKEKQCPLQNVTLSGGTFEARQTCHDLAGTRTTHWLGSYSPTGYTVNADTVGTGGNLIKMSVVLTAKRIGACH